MKYELKAKQEVKLSGLISEKIAGLGSSAVKNLISKREVKVNGERVGSDIMLNRGDEVYIFVPQKYLSDENVDNNITAVYEDDNILVVFKPILTEVEGHLTAALAKKYSYIKPVHRLDRNTTGLVMFAKNDNSYFQLLDAIKNREIQKYYRAIVYGKPPKSSDTLKAYLKKDADKSFCSVSAEEKSGYLPIVTNYTVIKETPPLYTLEVMPITGRTHQIRAHLKFIGCPIIGDGKYGDNAANKKYKYKFQQLCAFKLILGGLVNDLKYLNGKEIIAI